MGLDNDVQQAVDRAIAVRVGGIEKQLDEVRALLTRMVLVEERQSNYKNDIEGLRRDMNSLSDRMRLVETDNKVQETKGGYIDRILWKLVSGILAVGIVALEFWRK